MQVEPGFYVHYKGKLYSVVVIAKNSETLEELVVYRAMYDSQSYWVRSVTSFLEEVDVEGQKIPRFRKATLNESQNFLFKVTSENHE